MLRRLLDETVERLGRDITILDVGGRPDYWLNLPSLDRIARIDVMNAEPDEMDRPLPDDAPKGVFTRSVGDARRLEGHADRSVDFIHSNSVIEHVGSWTDMNDMARELRRVGRAGWMQTPAWSFPIEPHFHTPFMHWFGAPMRARMLSISVARRFRQMGLAKRRREVESVTLLTRAEVAELFPGCAIHTERVALLAKSYVAYWHVDDPVQDGRLRQAA
jgi:hypothetical protein